MTADIDEPIQLGGPNAPDPPAEQIALLADMGFTHAQARKALLETVRHWSPLTMTDEILTGMAGRKSRTRS